MNRLTTLNTLTTPQLAALGFQNKIPMMHNPRTDNYRAYLIDSLCGLEVIKGLETNEYTSE
jgi:hypothetical protein